MNDKRRIVINGRFASGAPTAVHRVAQELTTALSRILGKDHLRLLVEPGHDVPWSDAARLYPEHVGRLKGIPWEQISLPRAAHGSLVLNLCNFAPLTSRNAYTMLHDAQVFIAPDSYGRVSGAWRRLGARVAGRRQRGILTVSEFSRSELVKLAIAPPDRIHVVPNGLDHVLRVIPDSTVLERLRLAPGQYALALANTMPHKNIGLLLRAFTRAALNDLKLVLVGTDNAEAFAGAGHPVPPNVFFAGYVTDGEMRELQAKALAVCTPSLTEGFGMPPAEGLLLGTPAVIAPCGALPEVCGPGALHADPRDPEAWEWALLRLRDEPGLGAKMSVAGQAFAARFTWEAAAIQLLEVIDEPTSKSKIGVAGDNSSSTTKGCAL